MKIIEPITLNCYFSTYVYWAFKESNDHDICQFLVAKDWYCTHCNVDN